MLENQKVKKIIPCLDINGGRVVKGVRFENLKDAGDPASIASFYNQEGADELVFLDISATTENRQSVLLEMIQKVSQKITIPFTVGGGIRSLKDMESLLKAGASKVSLSTAAITNPDLVKEGVENFGSKALVVAVDVKKVGPQKWHVLIKGGKEDTQIDLIKWIQKLESLGVKEILLTSFDHDGTKSGYDIEVLKQVKAHTNLFVIASGGVGSLEHFYDGVVKGGADALLAASVFHFKEFSIRQVKEFLSSKGVLVNL